MSAIAVEGSMCTGHGKFPPRPVAETVPWFRVNGLPVVVDGALFEKHTDGKEVHTGTAISTRPWFRIGGRGVVCVGDPVSCGSQVATGDSSMQIG